MSLWGVCSFTFSGKNIGAKKFSLSHTNWHHCARPNCGIKGRTFPEKESIFFFQVSPALITFWDLNLDYPSHSKAVVRIIEVIVYKPQTWTHCHKAKEYLKMLLPQKILKPCL